MNIVSIQGNLIGRDKGGPVGVGVGVGGEMFTLTKTDVHAVAYGPQVSPALKARDYKGPSSDGDGDGAPLIAHTLRGEGFDASEDGTGRGTPLVPVPFDTTQITSATNRSNPRAGDPCHPLASGAHAPAIAFDARQSDVIQYGDKTGPLDTDGHTMGVQTAAAVRRLMPVECERLQGFPDGHTAVQFRGKPASDSVRYKALGNSWAVNCAKWIGQRIAIVDSVRPA